MATSAFARVPKTQKWAVAVQPSAVALQCEYLYMYKSMYRVQGARSARWEMQQRRERESRPVASGATAAPSKRYREGRKQKNRKSESRQRDAKAKCSKRELGWESCLAEWVRAALVQVRVLAGRLGHGSGMGGGSSTKTGGFLSFFFFFVVFFGEAEKDGTATERALFCPHTLANAAADIRWPRDHKGFWRGVEPRNRLERAREARIL